MSSGFESALQVLHTKNCLARMFVHTSGQWPILSTIKLWLSLASYMIMVRSAFAHPVLLKHNWQLQSHHFSPHLSGRGMLCCSPHLIYWLTGFKGVLCLGEKITLVKQTPIPLQCYSVDPGPGSLPYLLWCVWGSKGHFIASVLKWWLCRFVILVFLMQCMSIVVVIHVKLHS